MRKSVDEEWSFGVEGGGVYDEPVLSGEGRDVNGTGLGSDAEVVRGLGEGFVTGGGNQGCQNQNNGFLHGFCVLFPQN